MTALRDDKVGIDEPLSCLFRFVYCTSVIRLAVVSRLATIGPIETFVAVDASQGNEFHKGFVGFAVEVAEPYCPHKQRDD